MPAATLASLLVVSLSAATAAGTPAAAPDESLRASLGLQGVVDLDPLTGTPRVVARLDGFLTEPAGGNAVDIVLEYVRANESVFRLDEDDLAGLRIVRDETDVFGVRHLLWAQEAGGIPAFENDLRASVTSDGRIVNVLGSPRPTSSFRPTLSQSAAARPSPPRSRPRAIPPSAHRAVSPPPVGSHSRLASPAVIAPPSSSSTRAGTFALPGV